MYIYIHICMYVEHPHLLHHISCCITYPLHAAQCVVHSRALVNEASNFPICQCRTLVCFCTLLPARATACCLVARASGCIKRGGVQISCVHSEVGSTIVLYYHRPQYCLSFDIGIKYDGVFSTHVLCSTTVLWSRAFFFFWLFLRVCLAQVCVASSDQHTSCLGLLQMAEVVNKYQLNYKIVQRRKERCMVMMMLLMTSA